MSRTGNFAVVTGASSGIGFELARLAVADGHDVLIVAEEAAIEAAGAKLSTAAVSVETLRADLATEHGVADLFERIGTRRVDYFMANAGVGLGHAFLDQEWDEIARVIDLNVKGTTAMLHRVLQGMVEHCAGRVLVTGSIAGMIPGSYQAVYNASKAYLDNLSLALGAELEETGVTVTCLRPGPVDTPFFERAHMEDTPVGQDEDKADPAKVAREGFEAMMKGSSGITPGFMNKVQAALTGVLPEPVLARMHRRMARPEGED
ncbi:SDR family NAD(P)-dependent oxidoreductase [Limimaricola litoreus]|uniref:SDR family NAD(P)-dependent oxidoreductase n=1 Tax=Limimaricola litoreus TaxID=2955316 RepID=A0A9X2FRJ2_9RHOB|nr:SDR family NAD(P)-dependent oxidoreductase [Limimaricola litoreus]MCP1170554.1 SDR family NAD(P)-dependent oxidoreductase [Limimaricola litoreus]